MTKIDGNRGGGQVLRTALSLSMVTGKPFTIKNIRGSRPKPGLMRQHLTCVKAAAQISGARVEGVELLSKSLEFSPGKVESGTYEFAIGSAGSTTLIYQALLPALSRLDEPSFVTAFGGTHNPMAPSATFIERSFIPAVKQFGVTTSLDCRRVGFAPAGGGEITSSFGRFSARCERELESPTLHLLSTDLPESVPERIAKAVVSEFGECDIVVAPAEADGAGGCAHLIVGDAVVTGFAQNGISSERLGSRVAKEMNAFLESEADYTAQLADQLLLYLAMAGEGSISTTRLTNHIKSNCDTIAQFLPVRFEFDQETDGRVRILVSEV